jgi:hypothetical protein
MFEIDRQFMVAEIRCKACGASRVINTDRQRMIDRAVSEFQNSHRCRTIVIQQNETKCLEGL